MAKTLLIAAVAAAKLASAQVGGIGSSAAPFPNIVYPNATRVTVGAASEQTSPPEYPAPWGEGLGDWADAYAKATAFVSGLTLVEKVNITTGTGWESEKCVGNVGSIPRLGFKALCMQDSPLGVRFADYVSAFP
jgi:beta-glucosidase